MEISYSKTLSLYTSADVFVAGGGPSGIAAAVSAARLGKRVVLVEQTGVLGGASILCMVAEFMTFDDGENVNCESFLFDFSGDLYEKSIEISFLYFLRAERAFADQKALQEQIQKDILRAKAFFAGEPSF